MGTQDCAAECELGEPQVAKISDKMENFDDDFGAPPPADVDPAAEFLAKEQEDLGDIGEDLGLAPPQEISAFKEENDFTSNDLQDFIPAQSGDPMVFAMASQPEATYSGLEEFEAAPVSAMDGGSFLVQK